MLIPKCSRLYVGRPGWYLDDGVSDHLSHYGPPDIRGRRRLLKNVVRHQVYMQPRLPLQLQPRDPYHQNAPHSWHRYQHVRSTYIFFLSVCLCKPFGLFYFQLDQNKSKFEVVLARGIKFTKDDGHWIKGEGHIDDIPENFYHL